MSDHVEVTIKLHATPREAEALKILFEHWRRCAKGGVSQVLSFEVDGTNTFDPLCQVSTSEPVRDTGAIVMAVTDNLDIERWIALSSVKIAADLTDLDIPPTWPEGVTSWNKKL